MNVQPRNIRSRRYFACGVSSPSIENCQKIIGIVETSDVKCVLSVKWRTHAYHTYLLFSSSPLSFPSPLLRQSTSSIAEFDTYFIIVWMFPQRFSQHFWKEISNFTPYIPFDFARPERDVNIWHAFLVSYTTTMLHHIISCTREFAPDGLYPINLIKRRTYAHRMRSRRWVSGRACVQ